MNVIIFDSGSLITLSMNCLLDLIIGLKKEFDGKFLITESVAYEAVERPLGIKKYKLGALRVKQLIDSKILEFPESVGIKKQDIDKQTKEFLTKSNSVFTAQDRDMHLIDKGEASCLALSYILSQKGVNNVIVIDERTTRMLGEKPENLRLLLERKLHTKINWKSKENAFKDIKFIRSSELIYVAFKKGLVKDKSKEMLDALLYGAKFKGCAISEAEIKVIEGMN